MTAQALGAALAGALLAACATASPPPPRVETPPPRVATPPPAAVEVPNELYVLLPSRDGAPASLLVTRGGETKTLASPYAAARISRSGGLETDVVTETEAREVFRAALDAQSPRPRAFLLHFLKGSDELAPESRRVLHEIMIEIGSRPAAEVVVIGHTDTVGSVELNDRLSAQRADRTRAELVKLGVPRESIEASGRGKRELLVPTGDQVAEPRNRRVEVVVR